MTGQLGIIKSHHSHFRVYGTPFWEEQTAERTNGRTELRSLYVLKKDRRNDLITLEREPAVLALYRCISFFTDDSGLLSRVLDTCSEIVDKVPAYELHFRQDNLLSQLV